MGMLHGECARRWCAVGGMCGIILSALLAFTRWTVAAGTDGMAANPGASPRLTSDAEEIRACLHQGFQLVASVSDPAWRRWLLAGGAGSPPVQERGGVMIPQVVAYADAGLKLLVVSDALPTYSPGVWPMNKPALALLRSLPSADLEKCLERYTRWADLSPAARTLFDLFAKEAFDEPEDSRLHAAVGRGEVVVKVYPDLMVRTSPKPPDSGPVGFSMGCAEGTGGDEERLPAIWGLSLGQDLPTAPAPDAQISLEPAGAAIPRAEVAESLSKALHHELHVSDFLPEDVILKGTGQIPAPLLVRVLCLAWGAEVRDLVGEDGKRVSFIGPARSTGILMKRSEYVEMMALWHRALPERRRGRYGRLAGVWMWVPYTSAAAGVRERIRWALKREQVPWGEAELKASWVSFIPVLCVNLVVIRPGETSSEGWTASTYPYH